jgi:hypothetical protein
MDLRLAYGNIERSPGSPEVLILCKTWYRSVAASGPLLTDKAQEN